MKAKEVLKVVNTDLHIIVIYDDNSVDVFERFRNTRQGLYEIANAIELNFQKKFFIDPEWETINYLGEKILSYVGAKTVLNNGEYYLSNPMFFSTILCGKKYSGSTKEGLRKIAEKYHIEYDPTWNTQTLGRKIVNALN